MIEKEIIEGNKLIAEFMGWYIDIQEPSTDYPTQEWHTSRNINGEWDSSMCVHKTEPNVEDLRITTDEELWKKLTNPDYGRAGKYHKDWNRLMPVVEKIEDIGFYTESEGWKGCQYFYIKENIPAPKQSGADFEDRGIGVSKIKKEAVWLAVVEFIKWYKNSK